MKSAFILLFLLLLSQTAFCQIPESVVKESTVQTTEREVVKATKSIRLAPGTKIARGMKFSARIVEQEQVVTAAIDVNDAEPATTFQIEIFPNPAISEAQIELGNQAIQIDEAVLYSITGAVVKKYAIDKQNVHKSRHRFNVSGIPNGLYIFTLSNNGSLVISERLLIGR